MTYVQTAVLSDRFIYRAPTIRFGFFVLIFCCVIVTRQKDLLEEIHGTMHILSTSVMAFIIVPVQSLYRVFLLNTTVDYNAVHIYQTYVCDAFQMPIAWLHIIVLALKKKRLNICKS